MKTIIELSFLKQLKKNLQPKDCLIQVVLGPRQVGKTTSVQLHLEGLKQKDYHYTSADGDISKSNEWILEEWTLCKQKNPNGLLVIDEIQKVENWPEMIKKLWDEQKRSAKKIKVILLGSSSLQIQKGLSESLAGRYQMHPVYHWNFEESKEAYNLSYDEYLTYGGYPGSYPFIKEKKEWVDYIKNSIINPVIGKDILSVARVESPSLFRQCFDLICSYPAQEVSYNKLLGQLQNKGNVDKVKHYIDLFEKSFLIKPIFKYSNKAVLSRSSSPKFLPLCPALYSATVDADIDNESKGRVFEVIVGMALNRLPGEVFYWRERDYEVDYVYQYGKNIYAIEVKSHPQKQMSKGLVRFKDKFPKSQTLILTPENYREEIKKIND